MNTQQHAVSSLPFSLHLFYFGPQCHGVVFVHRGIVPSGYDTRFLAVVFIQRLTFCGVGGGVVNHLYFRQHFGMYNADGTKGYP